MNNQDNPSWVTKNTGRKLKNLPERYKLKVLIPLLGDGEIARRLTDGLVELIDNSFQPELPETTDSKLLDEKIDYNSMRELERDMGVKATTRIHNILGRAGIRTYGELSKFLRDLSEGNEQECIELYSKGYTLLKNFGKKSAEVLFKHLDSVNVRAFGREYFSTDARIFTQPFR